MTDTMNPEQRSKCMAAIKGKDTKPEMIVRKFLFSKGLRYRLYDKKLAGHPDMVLKKYRTAIFIDGCFWHGHQGCKHFRMPRSNVDFWQSKISHNKARDIANDYVLQTQGWKVLRVWECEIDKMKDRLPVLENLYSQIVSKPAAADMPAPYNLDETPPAIAAEPSPDYKCPS